MKCSASISVQYDNLFSPFPGKQWKKGFSWIKNSGFGAVEIILSDPSLVPLAEIQKMLQKLDLTVSTVSTGQAASLEGLSLVSPSREIRTQTIERLKDDIDLSVELGKPNVTVGLIRGRGGELSFEDEHNLLCNALTAVIEYAQTKGVTLNLEPINRYECRHLNDSFSAVQCIEEMGSPDNIGILYDTFHSNIEDPDFPRTVEHISSHISHVHIADSNRRLPGEGHVPFKKIRAMLEEAEYAGYVSLEVLNLPSEQHIIEFAAEKMFEVFR